MHGTTPRSDRGLLLFLALCAVIAAALCYGIYRLPTDLWAKGFFALVGVAALWALGAGFVTPIFNWLAVRRVARPHAPPPEPLRVGSNRFKDDAKLKVIQAGESDSGGRTMI